MSTPLTREVHSQLQAILGQREPSAASLNSAYRLLAKWRSVLIENTLVRRQGTIIGSGPFKGMDYPITASEGGRVPRLLGCYECTLHRVIEAIIKRAYPLVIDVGCAEGYYAVGLARRMPQSRVLARDSSEIARDKCRELAKANGLSERVEVGGEFAHADFDICTTTKSVVICDIEGAENELLDPQKAPGLLAADILVETHDGVSETIAKRFAPTHKITRLGRDVNMKALPAWAEEFGDLDRMTALWEWRTSATPWLWMQKK